MPFGSSPTTAGSPDSLGNKQAVSSKTRKKWCNGGAFSQEGRNNGWKGSAEQWRRKFWRSTQSRRIKKDAHKGRDEPSEWRIVQRLKRYQPRKWGEDCLAMIFSWFREHNLQRSESMHESKTEDGEMVPHDRDDKKDQNKGRMYAKNSRGVSELRTADCKRRAWLHPGHKAAMV